MKQIKPAPAKDISWIIWIFIIVVIIAIGVFSTRKKAQYKTSSAASDSTTVESQINNNWSGVNPNIPVSRFEELKDTDLHVRAADNYAIYSLREDVLFDPGKYNINQEASEKLKQIAGSFEKRFPRGAIRIYGYADTTGTRELNEKLARQRAEAVKNWFTENANISSNRISFYSKGEINPLKGSTTDKQQNRRVDIIVLKQK